jgi:hypothetical protein
LNDLQTVLADGKTTMDDQERIMQIAQIHRSIQDNYRFVAGFRSQVQIYIGSKRQENQDVNTLKHLYANH